ncbi:MAG TPA: hypothetical protein VGE76_12485 [Opitutaceae bacterium]
MTAILSALLALLKALPALERLFREIMKRLDEQSARAAVQRQMEKDARVAEAIARANRPK